jgi:transcriptional regulator with XRE-family HTH domain
MSVGESIKQRRKSMNITQNQLAELAGISANTLYKIERNQGNPRLKTLDKLASTLGLEITLSPIRI